MKSTKQINIKGRTYYFYNDIIDIIFLILDTLQLKILVLVVVIVLIM